MPPKAKFTKEEIITAALNIIRKNGLDALTARELGSELGSSARPIFTIFDSMDEVVAAAIASSRELYNQYVEEGLAMTPAFKGFGIQSIRFAMDEPKLFQLLFMHDHENLPRYSELLGIVDNHYEQVLKIIQDDFEIDYEQSKKLYFHIWAYAHGIASLCATKSCTFTIDEISEMLGTAFRCFMIGMRLPDDDNVKTMPSKTREMPESYDKYLLKEVKQDG